MKLFDWLGAARRENDEVNADAVRITALELALRQSNLKAMVWQTKAEDLQDKLDAQAPLVAYALKRKAAVKKYQSKGKRMEWEDKFFTEYVNVGEK